MIEVMNELWKVCTQVKAMDDFVNKIGEITTLKVIDDTYLDFLHSFIQELS